MSWAAGGQNRNGLHLFKFIAKPIITVHFLFENSLHIFLVFYRYFVYDNGVVNSLLTTTFGKGPLCK